MCIFIFQILILVMGILPKENKTLLVDFLMFLFNIRMTVSLNKIF